jgi:hypothetical protein
MSCRAMVFALAVIFVCFPPSVAQGIGNEEQPIRELAPGGRGGVERPPLLPDPIPSPPVSPQGLPYDGYQLVGFTEEMFEGNRGVLNLSRACGATFAGSRICRMEEILNTVQVPEVPDHLLGEQAWILTSEPEFQAHGIVDSTTNCAGWSSNSGQDHGLTIELGLQCGCYGAFLAARCDVGRVVACCARLP